jgi:dolichol-phosphate mannosyltransferase
MRRVDVICPVYAEGEGIAHFHRRLMSVLNTSAPDYAWHVIYVVDPAHDNTVETLESIARDDQTVEVLIMSRRFGHQIALVAGMDASTGDAAIMLDSDLQHPPELIPDLVRQWELGADVVQAVRNDGEETAVWKRVTSRWFYKTFVRVGSVELRPGGADYRLLSRRVLDVFRRDMREHNPFLRGLVSWVGFSVHYVAFQPQARAHGRTKYRLSKLIEFAINGVTSFSKMPLRFCIGAGMVAAGFSIIYGLFVVALALAGVKTAIGWPTLIVTTTFLGGLQLIFLGVLGEYIAIIFDEVKDRPRYIIARRLGRDNRSSAQTEQNWEKRPLAFEEP